MDEKTLVFDDWAMYLIENWLQARNRYIAVAHARRQIDLEMNRVVLEGLRDDMIQEFIYLYSYLWFILDYDLPRHQYAYPAYITLPPSCLQNLRRLLYIRRTAPTSEHYTLPTGNSEEEWSKTEHELSKQLAGIGQNYFGYNNK